MGKNSKQPVKERRAKIDEMRRQQQAAERRKTLLLITLSIIVGLGLIGAALTPALLKKLHDKSGKPATSFGVSAAAAACDPITDDKAGGSQQHVGPNTKDASITRVNYDTVPPSSGKHFAEWASPDRHFYTATDRPHMENLVHNLEHGYTVVWYDNTVKGSQLAALHDLAKHYGDKSSTHKFIVSAWDPSYGAFPAGKHIGISHWGAKTAHRELCGQVSGDVIDSFVKKFPFTDSPEPGAM